MSRSKDQVDSIGKRKRIKKLRKQRGNSKDSEDGQKAPCLQQRQMSP